jgi:aryl-alcohol dehydrogenase
MAAAASGADEIVAIDRVGHRLKLAAELGATLAIDTTGRDQQRGPGHGAAGLAAAEGQVAAGFDGRPHNPTVFIPRLLQLHRQGRFPVDRLVRNYPFAEVNTVIADSLSGATIKPVLTFD